MLRVVGKTRYWKPDEVSDLLADAYGAAVESGVPNALLEPAFVAAAGLLAQQHVELEQVAIGGLGMAIPRDGGR